MKILLTGATGFIGSHIAKGLLDSGFDVYATHRATSSFEKCIQFKNRITWINTESYDWKEHIKTIKPEQLIHVAWSGVDAKNRNNWELQIQNFWLSKEYFDLAKECCIKKAIAFGSQAEYGAYSFPVNETTVPNPSDAYGAIKTLTVNYLRNLFENSSTDWYWIRIFSVFGEGEDSRWLIPSVISKLLKKESIQLTSCEQQYNYLYIEDFVSQFLSVLICKENKSGIYNLCNSESIPLKDLLITIAELMNDSKDLLKFNEIPQRPGQNMYISGDNKKFINSFILKGYEPVGLRSGLRRTIDYLKKAL
jgi:nucleoside-diphosphate-sugar epimerase